MAKFEIVRILQSAIKNNGGLLYVSLGFVVNTVIGGIFWFYIASLVDVSEYGRVSYLIAASQIITTVGIFGLGISMTTYVAKGLYEIISQIKSLILISSVVLAILTQLLFKSLSLDLIVIGTMFFTITTSESLGLKKYKEFGLLNVAQKGIQIVISLALLKSLGIEAILISYAVSYLITSYKFFSIYKSFTLQFGLLLEKKRFILSSFGQEIIKIASLSLDKIFVGLVFGYVVLGMYTLGVQLLLVLGTIPNIMFAYLLPHDSSGFENKNIRMFGILLSVVLAVIMAIVAPLLLPLFFPTFSATPAIIQIMSFSIIPMTISSTLGSRMLGNEKGMFIIISASVLMASQFTLMFFLGNLYSNVGIAAAVLLSYCIEASLQFALYKKLISKSSKLYRTP